MTAHLKDTAASLLMVWNTLQAKLSSAVNPDELLMNPEEVSAYTSISVPALAMMRHRGNGPDFTRPTPRTILYRKGDVDAWVKAGSSQGIEMGEKRCTDAIAGTIAK